MTFRTGCRSTSDPLTPADRYKLLTCLVVPRPIALVTTLDSAGVVNAAPFSFFNVVGSDPPIVVLGVGDRPGGGGPKDTAANVRRGRQFVVNVVTEEIAAAMNVTATDFPAGVSELPAAGLTAAASVRVRPPRVAESPVNFECEEVQTIAIGSNRVIMGRVVHLCVRDDLIDPVRMHVNAAALHAVGRMHAPGWYCRTNDLFEMRRMTYEQWQQARTPKA